MVPPPSSDSAAGRRDRTAHRLARLTSEWDAVRASTALPIEHDRTPVPDLASAAPDTHTRVTAARRHRPPAGPSIGGSDPAARTGADRASGGRGSVLQGSVLQGSVLQGSVLQGSDSQGADDPHSAPAIHDRATAPDGGAVPVPAPGRHARRRPGLVRLLPGSWPGRVDLGSAQLTVVALLVAAGLAVTSWWVLRSDEEQVAEPMMAAALATPSDQPAPGGAEPAAEASAASPSGDVAETVLVVDVVGKVRRPGLVELPAGSRVADAVREAGGSRPGASMAGVNLARPLVDGEQILIGADQQPAPAGSPVPSASAAPTLVNLNTADATALEELPQVGPVTAAAIVAWRTEHGSFTTVEELLEVDGIGDATLVCQPLRM